MSATAGKYAAPQHLQRKNFAHKRAFMLDNYEQRCSNRSMNLDDIVQPFKGMTFDQLKPVAVELGVPHGTLYRVVKGYTKNPRYETLRKMAVFKGGNAGRQS